MVSMYVLGTKGRVSIQQEFFFQAHRAEAVNFDNEVIASCELPFLKNGYEYEAMEVMECIRAGRTESELVRPDDTIAVMEILDTCRRQVGFQYDFE